MTLHRKVWYISVNFDCHKLVGQQLKSFQTGDRVTLDCVCDSNVELFLRILSHLEPPLQMGT